MNRAQGGERVLLRLELLDHRVPEPRHPFGNHHAILVHQPVDCIDQGRPPPPEPFAHPVEGLEVLLGDVCDRHKAHRRPRHRFGDRFGIPQIVLVRFHVRFHKLWRHQLDLMAVRSKAARPGMGATAGFHPHKRRGERRDTGHHLRAIEPFADQNRPVLIHPHEGKPLFGNVDADDAKLLHRTRLLWLNDFTRLEIILAHCSRSAQGAGPFHYDLLNRSICLVFRANLLMALCCAVGITPA